MFDGRVLDRRLSRRKNLHEIFRDGGKKSRPFQLIRLKGRQKCLPGSRYTSRARFANEITRHGINAI